MKIYQYGGYGVDINIDYHNYPGVVWGEPNHASYVLVEDLNGDFLATYHSRFGHAVKQTGDGVDAEFPYYDPDTGELYKADQVEYRQVAIVSVNGIGEKRWTVSANGQEADWLVAEFEVEVVG